MNQWVRRSIELANNEDYLDRLQEVYPILESTEREIPQRTESRIREAFANRDRKELVKILLQLNKFPIDDPYVSLIRGRDNQIENNPQVVNRLADTIFSIGVEGILDKCKTPKKPNTQMGPSFSKWLRTLPYDFLPKSEFHQAEGVSFLEGSDKALMSYANREWNCALTKGLDLVFKTERRNVIGEAKYLGTSGGKQNNAFDEAIDFIHKSAGDATRIAVLDGFMWLEGGQKMQRKIRLVESIAISALLLPEFIESLQ